MWSDQFPTTQWEFDDCFATEQACEQYLMQTRWPHGWRCPRCDHDRAWLTVQRHMHCRTCGHQSSLTAGTIFHGTQKPLRLWFRAMFLIASQQGGRECLYLAAPFGFELQHRLDVAAQATASHGPARPGPIERIHPNRRDVHRRQPLPPQGPAQGQSSHCRGVGGGQRHSHGPSAHEHSQRPEW